MTRYETQYENSPSDEIEQVMRELGHDARTFGPYQVPFPIEKTARIDGLVEAARTALKRGDRAAMSRLLVKAQELVDEPAGRT